MAVEGDVKRETVPVGGVIVQYEKCETVHAPLDDAEQQPQQHQQSPAPEARSLDLSSDCSSAVEHADGGVPMAARGGEPTGGRDFPEKLVAGTLGAAGGTEAGGTEVVTRENDDDKIMEVTLIFTVILRLVLDYLAEVSGFYAQV